MIIRGSNDIAQECFYDTETGIIYKQVDATTVVVEKAGCPNPVRLSGEIAGNLLDVLVKQSYRMSKW